MSYCSGIRGKDCVVLAVEKKSSSVLIDESSYHKVQNISEHLGGTYAGLGPDFRVLMMKARKITQKYWCKFHENIGINHMCFEVAKGIQEYTQSGSRRPFGNSILVAGYDDQGPHLFQLLPSGAYQGTPPHFSNPPEWKAIAIGEHFKNAKEFLERRYNPDLLLEDVIHTALLTLKENFEGTVSALSSFSRRDELEKHRDCFCGQEEEVYYANSE